MTRPFLLGKAGSFFGTMLAFGILAFAQVPTAVLTGVVKDPTGALVPNVKVVAISTDTNLSRQAVTDESGTFRIAALNPGPYKLEAEAAGFKKSTIDGIVLEVGQQSRVDVVMQVGDISQTVEVTGHASIVNTESNLIGGVIDQSRVVSLPLNGRNFMELTTLTAGIAEGTGSAAIVNKRAPTAAGMPHQDNNYQLDGADNKEAFFNSWNLGPSVDAIQEFSIQVGQYSAEFGAGGGAVINVVTKSGTNQLHGAAWEFLRNNEFDARNFFLTPSQTIAPLRRNQFGVAAGGPIIKNKMFLFGNYDGSRIRQGVFRTGVVPTAAQFARGLQRVQQNHQGSHVRASPSRTTSFPPTGSIRLHRSWPSITLLPTTRILPRISPRTFPVSTTTIPASSASTGSSALRTL